MKSYFWICANISLQGRHWGKGKWSLHMAEMLLLHLFKSENVLWYLCFRELTSSLKRHKNTVWYCTYCVVNTIYYGICLFTMPASSCDCKCKSDFYTVNVKIAWFVHTYLAMMLMCSCFFFLKYVTGHLFLKHVNLKECFCRLKNR